MSGGGDGRKVFADRFDLSGPWVGVGGGGCGGGGQVINFSLQGINSPKYGPCCDIMHF